MTLGLKSWVCLGGRCGQSSCNLWTEPGLVVPGKTTARLDGWRQLDTLPAPAPAPQVASENPKMTNALPNSRVVEGERQVQLEPAHCAGWGGASRWAGSTCERPQLQTRSSKVCYVPPDTGRAPRLNLPPFRRAPWWMSEDNASNIDEPQGPAGLTASHRRRIKHRKRSCGHRPAPCTRPPNVSTSSGCAGNGPQINIPPCSAASCQ